MSEKPLCALKEQTDETEEGQLSVFQQKGVGKGGRCEETWGQCPVLSKACPPGAGKLTPRPLM